MQVVFSCLKTDVKAAGRKLEGLRRKLRAGAGAGRV